MLCRTHFHLTLTLISYCDHNIMLRGWSDSFSNYSLLTSCYEYGKIHTIVSYYSIVVEFFITFTFGVNCIFWRWLCLTVLWSPVTNIAPIIVRLVWIGSSWVYLYSDRTFSVDEFTVSFDQKSSINQFAELGQSIYIDRFAEFTWTISNFKSCWFSDCGTFFWMMFSVKILLPLSIYYPFYQYISLEIG